MTVRIEQEFSHKGITIAAVVRQDVSSRAGWFAHSLSARKEPIAILVHDGRTLRALRPDGETFPIETLSRLCPQVADFPTPEPA